MITLRKLSTLKVREQVRKAGALMRQASKGLELPPSYPEALLNLLLASDYFPEKEDYLKRKFVEFEKGDLSAGEDIYYATLDALGEETADWDFTAGEVLDTSVRLVFDHYLFLDKVRSPYNIGAIFRSAESFGVKQIFLREGSGDIRSPRCLKTARGTLDSIPHSYISDLSLLPRPIFALETGGADLDSFKFPTSGTCVIGSEESGVSPELLALCESRVSIPQFGAKGSLNVSVASGILLYKWAIS